MVINYYFIFIIVHHHTDIIGHNDTHLATTTVITEQTSMFAKLCLAVVFVN